MFLSREILDGAYKQTRKMFSKIVHFNWKQWLKSDRQALISSFYSKIYLFCLNIFQYRIGQLYMIARHSFEQSSNGEGVEVVANEEVNDEINGHGQFTEKRIHLSRFWSSSFYELIFAVKLLVGFIYNFGVLFIKLKSSNWNKKNTLSLKVLSYF